MSTPKDLVAIGRAARLVGCSVETLRRLGRRGIIAEHRDYRGRRFFLRDDLLRLREARQPKPVQQPGNRSTSRVSSGCGP